MKISKKSWHYRAYDFSYRGRGKSVPLPKDGCSYLRRVIVVAPSLALGILAAALFLGIIITIAYILLGIVRFIMGDLPFRGPWKEYKAIFSDEAGDGTNMWNYRAYAPPRIGRLPLYPYVVILICALTYFAFRWGGETVSVVASSGAWLWYALMSHGYILGFALLASLIAWAIYLLLRIKTVKEWLGFVREYLKAKKGKICPVIELED